MSFTVLDSTGATKTFNSTVVATVHTAWSIPSDGTLSVSSLFDLDTGAGTENQLGMNLRISASGGSIEAKGQQLMASSIPVAIASNQSTLTVAGSGTFTVAGTATVTQGTAATLSGAWPVQVTDKTNTMPTMDAAARAGFIEITDGTNTATVKAASTAAAAADKSLVVAISPNVFGQATKANSVPVALASDQFAAAGAAIAGNPVTIGGWDGTNAQWLSVDSANAAKVKPKSLVVTGTGINSGDTPIAATDASDYGFVSVQLTGASGSAALAFEISNDNTNWLGIGLYDRNQGATTPFTTNPGTTASIYYGSIRGRYFRVRISTTSGATVTGTAIFTSAAEVPSPIQAVCLSTTSGANTQNAQTNFNSDNVVAGGSASMFFSTAGYLMNATSGNFDRARNNVDVSLLASAARTVTTNSSDQTNYNGRTLALFVNVSSAGTGSITPAIQVKDSISGDYFTIWTAATALTVNGDYVYNFADGASGGSFTESKPFGLHYRTWRLQMVANNANSVTYSASGITGV